MDLLLILVTVFGGLVLFAFLSTMFGADSRESIGDDWQRPIQV